ncbi:MAG: response regulator, partial [Sphingobium sp.]
LGPLAVAAVPRRGMVLMGRSVLIVEDEDLIRSLRMEVVRDAGFDVMEAADGDAMRPTGRSCGEKWKCDGPARRCG